jgi:hypothetical protein
LSRSLRLFKRCLLGLPLGLVLLVFFQNCTFDDLAPTHFKVARDLDLTDGSKIDLSSQGNGGSYDGKIDAFARIVPGFTCEGKGAAFATFQRGVDFATLYSGCDKKSEIPLRDMEFSKLSDNYAGYQEGLFGYSKDLQSDLKNGAFTEAWCQALVNENDDKILPLFEIGIHWEQAGNKALSRFYTGKDKPVAEAEVIRRLDIEKVHYYSPGSSLAIQFLTRLPGTHKFPGVFHGSLNGTSVTLPVQCRLGGQFDPVAPQLSYPEIFQTLIQGKSSVKIIPTLNKGQGKFSVSPELPNGLAFNATTGEISGTPTTLQARQKYRITAVLDFGEISRTISIGIGTEMSIEPTCALDACSFLNSIERANAQAPLPAVINFTGSQTWSGVEVSITGDVEIRGTNAVFDARGLSRHFSVKPKGVLSLSGITLKNGTAGAGGSISVESATLNIARSRFENNQATAENYGSGGAILVRRGDLSVTDSVFINNKTSMNGGNLFGGAISAEDCAGLLIARSEFRGNSSAGGGAIYIENASNEVLEMTDLIVSGNSAFHGAGIQLRSGAVMIKNSLFEKNNALIEGGGLYAFWTNRVWLDNSRLTTNSADRGSAISYSYFAKHTQFYILNSEIRDNVMNPRTLRNYPMIRGSALNFDGSVVFHNSVIANAIPSANGAGGFRNCSTTFPGDPENSTVLLGENIFNDSSCENRVY